MAVINVPSSIQGQTYSVRIAGDAPTPEEQAKIDAYVAQMDSRLGGGAAAQQAAPEGKTGGIGSALGVGADMLQQAYGSALEGAASSLGLAGLRDYGRSVADYNAQQIKEATPGLTGWDDVNSIGSGLSYFGQTLAQQVPQLGVSLAGAGAGALAGSAVPVVGTTLGAIAGGALANLPFFYGSNRERQKEADVAAGRPVNVDEGTAFLTSIPQATIDAIVDRMLVGKLIKPELIGSGNILLRTVKGAGAGIAAEVPSEIGQQVLERAQAGLPLDSEDAIAEYAAIARDTAIVGGTVGSVSNVAGGDVRKKQQAEKDKRAASELEQDQADEAQDVLKQIGFGQKSMEAAVEDAPAQVDQPVAGLLPPPTIGQPAPAPARAATPPVSRVQVEGVDDAIANGVANLKVKEDGKDVPFKTFALSVDGNTAEVGFVEKQQGARKGIGRDAYVALGNQLAGKGITLQSTETLLKDGNALWKGLEKAGHATYNPQAKRFQFTPQAAPQAAPQATSTAAGTQPTQAAPAPTQAAPKRPQNSFSWRQYQATLQNIGKAKAPTILAIQKAAETAGSGPVAPAVARDIRAQMERDGVIAPSAKVKGGYEYKPNVTPQVDRAESYQRTIEDAARDAAAARLAREKAVQDARRAEQTGKKADARKFLFEVDKADQAIATAERTIQETTARLPMAQQEQAVQTTQQPGSRIEGRQAFAPITEAPPAIQSRAVTDRTSRLRQAMQYYQNQAATQTAEVRRLQAAQKKAQLPKSELKRMEDLRRSAAEATAAYQQIAARIARPAADIEENVAQQKAAVAKDAAVAAERAARTPIYSQKEGQIMTALRKRLDNLGLSDVRLVAEKMLNPQGANQNALTEGMFDAKDGNRVIALSMGIYDPNMSAQETFDAISGVMNHEVIHALRNLGLFTNAEWKTLSDLAARQQYMKRKDGKVVQRNYTYLQRAKQMYASDTAEVQIEEAVAEMFRDYTAGHLKIGGRPKTLMDRIRNFIRSIWKAHEDVGMTDPNQIFEGVRFGEIGRRERNPAAPEVQRQSRVAAERAPSDPNFRKWASGPNGERVITDDDGNPKVFYTGTSKDQDFTSFKVGRHGGWFTADPEEASRYAEENDSMGFKQDGWKYTKTNTASRVIPAFIRAANPYTGPLPDFAYASNYKKSQSDWFDTLRRDGYDAWMPSDNPGLAVVLSDANQVKSVFARGTGGNGDMRRYSRVGATEDQDGRSEQDVGIRPAGENADGEGTGRKADQQTSPAIAPRTEYGGTDLGGLTIDDLNDLSPRFFKRPGWTILTATVEKNTPDQNARAHERLKEELAYMNIPYREAYGVYEGNPDGVSYIALMDEPTAIMLGQRYGQDSVLTNKGLVYARAPMPRNIREEAIFTGDEARAKDFYTQIGDDFAFSLDLDFANSGPTVADIGPGYYTIPERPQLPIRAADGKVELHHWSHRKLKNVDPAKAGTGPLEGDERRRGAELGFFGIMPRPDVRAQGTGYVKEEGLGEKEHIALVDPQSLYPYFTDPDNLSEGLDWKDPYFENDYEERIKDAGYKGYYTERIKATTPLGEVTPFHAKMGNVAAMFVKTPVKPAQEVQLGLRNPVRYSVRKAVTAPLTQQERRLTVLDRMDPNTGEFFSDGKKRDVVQALTDLFTPRRNVVISSDDPNAVPRVAKLMLAELRMALIRSPEAVGWYGTTLAKAKRVAAILHPEISPVNPYSGAKSNSYDPDAEHAWDLAMAITSNGMAVSENAKFANEQYEYWKEHGFFREEGTGEQGSGMAAAFRAYNAMKRSMTDAQIADFLSQEMTVSALKKNPIVRSIGIDLGSKEAATTMVNGSYIFGPKIGQGFYQNLRGNFDPLTMDLWFMRMFNRLTGRPFKQITDDVLLKNANRVIAAANSDSLSEYDQRAKKAAMDAENIDIITPENAGRFAVAFDKVYQRDFRKMPDEAIKASGLDSKSREAKAIGKAARPVGSELVLAAKTFRQNLAVNPQDTPRDSRDRTFMRQVVDEVRSALANEGTNISTADIQAVMWYAEKQLFAAMGVRAGKGADNDYIDGAIELLRSKGVEDDEITRGLPAAERDRLYYRTASERAAARLRGWPDADGEVEGRSGTGDVSKAPLGGGSPETAVNGREGGLNKRLSVRYAQTASVQQTQRQIAQNQSALMYARASDLIAKALNLGGRGMEATKAQRIADTILRKFQDSMLPVGRMVQELSKAGLTITDAMDPYLQEELMHGVVGQKIDQNQKELFQPLLDGVKALNVPKAKIDALVQATDAVSAKGKGFLGLALERYGSPRLALAEAFLYARHAKERNRFILSNRDKTNANGSGMNAAEADAIINWFSGLDAANKEAITKVGQQARAIVENTNRTRVDAGLISRDVAGLDPDSLDGANFRHYVPLRGKVDEESDEDFRGAPASPKFGAKGREDQQALGRFDYASDLIGNLFSQNQSAILRGERNKVGQSFLKLLRANPQMTSSYAKVLDRMPTIRASVNGKIREVPDPRAAQDPDILVVKEDGKQTWVRFTDLSLAGALNGKNGMSPTSSNVALRAMQKLNRYLSTINTSYNPEFIITNFFRDAQTGLLNMNQHEQDGAVRDVIGGLKGAVLGIREAIRKGSDQSEWAKVYKDFVAAGGQNVTNEFNSLSDEMANIKTMLGDISEAGMRGQWAKVKNGFVGNRVGSMIHLIEDYNTIAENAIRVSCYKALLDRGFTRQRAAQAARNLTVNFAKGGDYRQFMNSWYLFYNASLQGSFALLNAAVRSRRVQKMWLGIVAAGMAQEVLNSLFSPEDDDGKKAYDKIPDYVLERNFVLPDFLGITGRSYISIPMPYGLNMAHNIGRNVVAAARGAVTPGEAALSVGRNIIDTLNPIGGTESFYNLAAPTVLDPFIDIVENEDYADKQIYKENLPFDKTPQPNSQQYWSTTSPSAVWISNMLNDVTGGNEVRPGFIDWSPDVLEFWFDFATGGIGRFAQGAIEAPINLASEGLTEDAIRGIPLARKLVGSVSSREDTGAYMDRAKEVLMAAEELKTARENGDQQWAADTIRNYGAELRLVGPIKSIESSLRKLAMQRRQVEDNPNIPDQQRRLILDALDKRKQMLLSRGNALLNRLE